MSTVAAGYGLVPIKNADGSPYCGARGAYLMTPAGYNKNIGFGSIVKMHAGYLELGTADGSANNGNNFGGAADIGAWGVFVGCEYINTVGQLIFSQYYPANTEDATAYVVTDPGVTFQAKSAGAIAQASLGLNVALATAQTGTAGVFSAQAGGVNITTGKANSVLSASPAVTETLAFKIVGFSDRADGDTAIGDTYTDVHVKFNPLFHQFGISVKGEA